MSERKGIEIDYCPECRGVWLDRGELDKIIDRSMGETGTNAAPPMERPQNYTQQQPPPKYDQYRGDHYKKKKKEGFLSDLFDF